jgi:putative membrane protein
MATAGGLVIALAAVPLAPIHAQGQISQLSQDSKLIFQMAGSNIMEVRLGQMAQQKGSNAAVKQFGQQMVTAHTNLENQLTGLVSKNGNTFQPSMGKDNEAEVSRLDKLSGAEFDRQYMTSMIQHHQQDVATLQNAGQTASSAEAKQMVSTALPVLQQHLTMATQVGGQVGANGGVAVATQPGQNPTSTTPTTTTQNPTVSAQPGQVTSQAQGDINADMPFIREAASSNLMEIRLGQVAQTKGSNQAVKQFGQRMVADHTNLENQLSSAASTGGQTFTPTLDSRHERMATRLEGLSGAEFDRQYMGLMIRGHQRDVSNFQTQSQSARSSQVRTLATNSLPVLQQHLSLAVQVGGQVGADSTTNYAGGNGGNQAGGGANGNIQADAGFIREVNSDNQMQIQLAQLARERAKDSQVRQFADQIITDHTRLQNQWRSMASRNGMTLRDGLGPMHREKITNLQKFKGTNFDKAYMTVMIQQHSDEVSYWQKEGRDSQSPEVRRLVNAGLPTLEQHFNQAKQIGRQVGVNPDNALRNRTDIARDKNKDKDKDKDKNKD